MRKRTSVMEGQLAGMQLAEVLQVVGLSRQFTAVELKDTDGGTVGSILLKSGKVLRVDSRDGEGRVGFFNLFSAPPEHFHVWRMPDPDSFPSPLGSLDKLLMEALEHGAGQASPPAPPRRAATADRGSAARRPERAPTPTGQEASGPSSPRATPQRSAPTPALAPPPERRAAPPSPPPTRRREGAPPSLAVAIASPKGGVGKTTIALNLAVSFANQGVDTLLIDADPNGDVLSSIDARRRVRAGVFDILAEPDRLASIVRRTAHDRLRIAPALGAELADAVVPGAAQHEQWRRLLAEARRTAQVVLVDCPAGMFGTTLAVMHGVSHVLGVFQAEMLASRSFEMFERAMDRVALERRPTLAGVVVNMLHGRSEGSVEALQRIALQSERLRLFETTIPRSEAFQRAARAGLPLRMADHGQPHAVAWLFDMLAAELQARALPARAPAPGRADAPGAFLL